MDLKVLLRFIKLGFFEATASVKLKEYVNVRTQLPCIHTLKITIQVISSVTIYNLDQINRIDKINYYTSIY